MKLPGKPYPVNNREATVDFAVNMYPQAENELVAVDLLSQYLYKYIQGKMERKEPAKSQFDDIEFYGYLKGLINELRNEEVNKHSSYTYNRMEAVNE